MLTLLACCHYVIIVIEMVGWVRNGATELGKVKECGDCRQKTRGGAANATSNDGLVTVAARAVNALKCQCQCQYQ